MFKHPGIQVNSLGCIHLRASPCWLASSWHSHVEYCIISRTCLKTWWCLVSSVDEVTSGHWLPFSACHCALCTTISISPESTQCGLIISVSPELTQCGLVVSVSPMVTSCRLPFPIIATGLIWLPSTQAYWRKAPGDTTCIMVNIHKSCQTVSALHHQHTHSLFSACHTNDIIATLEQTHLLDWYMDLCLNVYFAYHKLLCTERHDSPPSIYTNRSCLTSLMPAWSTKPEWCACVGWAQHCANIPVYILICVAIALVTKLCIT